MTSPRFCALIPTYDNPRTIARVSWSGSARTCPTSWWSTTAAPKRAREVGPRDRADGLAHVDPARAERRQGRGGERRAARGAARSGSRTRCRSTRTASTTSTTSRASSTPSRADPRRAGARLPGVRRERARRRARRGRRVSPASGRRRDGRPRRSPIRSAGSASTRRARASRGRPRPTAWTSMPRSPCAWSGSAAATVNLPTRACGTSRARRAASRTSACSATTCASAGATRACARSALLGCAAATARARLPPAMTGRDTAGSARGPRRARSLRDPGRSCALGDRFGRRRSRAVLHVVAAWYVAFASGGRARGLARLPAAARRARDSLGDVYRHVLRFAQRHPRPRSSSSRGKSGPFAHVAPRRAITCAPLPSAGAGRSCSSPTSAASR